MPVVEESVFIARPHQEVFDFISEPTNIPVWDSSVMKTEMIGTDPIGLGSRARGTSKIMGKHFDWTTELTEFEYPRRLTAKSIEGQMKFAVSNVLEPTEGGTKLTFRIDAESGLGGIFGKLADPFITKVQARTVRANLETLAELLTEGPTD